MAQLRLDHDQFVKRKIQVVILGPEDETAFRTYWVKHHLPFIGIPDPHGKVLKAFGQEVNLFKLGRMPAQVLVDSNQNALFAHYGHSMSDIPANSEIFEVLDAIPF